MSDTKPATLLAVYDFAVTPYTYDFFVFLVAAEAQRRAHRLDAVHIVLVPPPRDVVNTGANISAAEQAWRLHNLIIPGTALLASLDQLTICTDRAQAEPIVAAGAHVFPPKYTFAHPVGIFETVELTAAWARGIAIPSLTVPEPAKNYVRQYLDARAHGRRVVTVTLRQATHIPERNSNLQAWTSFAASLDPHRYLVVFIPDTQAVFDAPDPILAPFTIFGDAATNVLIRAALYELSFVNMFRSNGPANLASLNQAAPLLNFVKPMDDVIDQSVYTIETGTGIKVGTQFPYYQPRQKWAWCDDSADNIAAEFATFEAFADGRIAIEDFKSAAMDSPRAIAELLSRSDRPVQAREIFEHLLAQYGYDPDIAFAIVKLDNERGAHDAALERLQELARHGRQGYEIDEQSGDAHSGLKQLPLAIAAYQNALKAPELAHGIRVRIIIKLGYLLVRRGRAEEAQTLAEAALTGAAQDRFLLQFVGEIWTEQGEAERAHPFIAREIACLRVLLAKAASRHEIDGGTASRLCNLYIQTKQFDDAYTLAREIEAQGSARFTINELLGDALAGLGRVDDAIRHFEAGIAQTWGRHGPLLFKLARLQIAQGDLAAAERNMRACIDVQATHVPAYELLAQILMQQNRTADSFQVLIQARELAMR